MWVSGWRCTGRIGSPLPANCTRDWPATRANLSPRSAAFKLRVGAARSPSTADLIFRRVISNPTVRFPGSQLPYAKLGQIALVALVDLRHGQVPRLHHILTGFHFLGSVRIVDIERTAAFLHANAKLP